MQVSSGGKKGGGRPKGASSIGAISQSVVGHSEWDELRERMGDFLNHPIVNNLLFCLILASLVLLVLETDAQAVRGTYEQPVHPKPSVVLKVLSWSLLAIFVIETAARIFVLHRRYFSEGWLLDFVVVVGDVSLTCAEQIMTSYDMPSIAFLRLFRLLRLLRVLKVVKKFPELNFLLNGMLSSFMAIFWGMIMVFIILLIWSIVCVQIIHDINFEVQGKQISEYVNDSSDCMNLDACNAVHAYSSVWNAFVTLTQTLLFGDGWGITALPVILETPTTYLIFLMAYASVGLAALNLILAAIVDSGQQAREDAAEARQAAHKKDMAKEEEANFNYLLDLCQQIDDDDSGRLSKDELLHGFQKNHEFSHAMRDMGYCEMDLQVLYPFLDRDGDGTVDYNEFLELMRKTKLENPQQMMIFIKYSVMDIWRKMDEQHDVMHKKIDATHAKIHATVESLTASSRKTLPKVAELSGSGRPTSKNPQGAGSNGARQGGKVAQQEKLPSRQTSTESSLTASEPGSLPGRSADRLSENKRITGPVRAERGQTGQNGTRAQGAELLLEPKQVTNLGGSSDELCELMKKIAWQTEAQSGTLVSLNSMISDLVQQGGHASLEAAIDKNRSQALTGALEAPCYLAGGTCPSERVRAL